MSDQCQYRTHTSSNLQISRIYLPKKRTNVFDLAVEFVVFNELKSVQVNLRVYHHYCNTPSPGSSTSEKYLDEKKSVLKYPLRKSRQGLKYSLV